MNQLLLDAAVKARQQGIEAGGLDKKLPKPGIDESRNGISVEFRQLTPTPPVARNYPLTWEDAINVLHAVRLQIPALGDVEAMIDVKRTTGWVFKKTEDIGWGVLENENGIDLRILSSTG